VPDNDRLVLAEEMAARVIIPEHDVSSAWAAVASGGLILGVALTQVAIDVARSLRGIDGTLRKIDRSLLRPR